MLSSLPVIAEVVLAAEGLVADITFVGPLVGVCALVDEKVVGFGELAFAEAADEFCNNYRRADVEDVVVLVRGVFKYRSIWVVAPEHGRHRRWGWGLTFLWSA